METITIQVDSETAHAYSSANEAMRRKMAILFRLCVKEVTDPNTTLDEAMERISSEAQAQGLTPELLESLLNDQ